MSEIEAHPTALEVEDGQPRAWQRWTVTAEHPLVKGAAQSIAAAAGVGIGGPAGAVIGAVVADPLVQLAGRAWDEIRGLRAQHAGLLVREAADLLDEDPETMVTTALSGPESRRILHEALQAAAATLEQQKVEALARCLANGLNDGTKVDQETLIIRALADLDPIHVRALDLLSQPPIYQRSVDVISRELGLDGPIALLNGGQVPGSAEIDATSAVLAVLLRHGLIESKTNDVPGIIARRQKNLVGHPHEQSTVSTYTITRFGIACAQRLQRASTED